MAGAPRPNDASATGTPRWVKVFAAIALVAVVVITVLVITGGGGHGPSRHAPADDAGHTGPPAGLTHTQP